MHKPHITPAWAHKCVVTRGFVLGSRGTVNHGQLHSAKSLSIVIKLIKWKGKPASFSPSLRSQPDLVYASWFPRQKSLFCLNRAPWVCLGRSTSKQLVQSTFSMSSSIWTESVLQVSHSACDTVKGYRLHTNMFNEAEYCKHKQQKYFVYLTFTHTQVNAC